MNKKKSNEKEEEVTEVLDETENVEEDVETVEAEEVSEADILNAQIAELEKAVADEKEKLLRTAAEYANYRTRSEREKSAIYSSATADIVGEIIPIADNIYRAIDLSKNAPDEFKKGLEMIASQLDKSFGKLNITAFGEVGDKFDPNFHNAVSSVDNDEFESDTITAVYQKGYKVGDKIIRHAMVQISN